VKQSLRFKDTLESAQQRKIDFLLSKLEPLGPENTLLDIGFGWGGICIRAAEKYGCRVTGITLSVEQKRYAEELVKQKKLSHLITFELIDYRVFANRYRDSNTKFDRIVSCEMIEAVGHNYLNSFFESIDMLLDIEGIFVMQAITMPDSRYELYRKSTDFLNTIIFPGGCCPSLSALLNAMSLKSTLHLDSAINIDLHYAETLKRWRTKFNQNLPEIIRLGFDAAFFRLWNAYLTACEAGFDSQVLNLQILTFSRTGNPNLSIKRIISQNLL
jgi:cyclopropane-fatty-acyl-phospholipid synthase